MNSIKKIIRKNVVAVLASLVLVLIIFSTLLVIENRTIMIRTTQQQELSEQTLVKADFILNNLQAIDLGLRAYAITADPAHLRHYKEATGETLPAFDELDKLLRQQNFKSEDFQNLKKAMLAYHSFCDEVVAAVDRGETEKVKEMIVQDKGYEAWSIYQNFFKQLSAFEKGLSSEAKQDYDKASSGSIWIMLVLLFFSLPSLGFIVYVLNRTEKNRKKLFIELEHNNRKYNFNSGEPITINNEYQLINSYIDNSRKAADFVNQVAAGTYDVEWNGLTQDNIALNQESLAGALVKMRDQMKSVKVEEERRQWISRGLTEISELIRNNQESIETLANSTIVYLVKYLKAQQGGFFVVNKDEDTSATSIDMAACYAFNRQKYISTRIEIGEGLVGQAYLEAETILLTEIPKGYTRITSGLGDATPTCLLVVPMKYNDEVQVIIEIASFVVYDKFQIEFLEKVGEFVAAAVSTAKTNEMTRRLLQSAQQMAEEMKSQEEEMRQNMEELSATQEEMHRKEKEYIQRIEELESQLELR
ncbi:CHASE3 domain-containing protein [Cesiribacter sp. SM1]|uniref:CHASE3 domain-containing protein n=1 Tax=Cesiribacter sp. SM1 TaxID=2861196 RepID=UPI001CD3080D|nr:CHASE3 domain-containing protein [Cesiribacter sp. SM1]